MTIVFMCQLLFGTTDSRRQYGCLGDQDRSGGEEVGIVLDQWRCRWRRGWRRLSCHALYQGIRPRPLREDRHGM